MDIKLHNPRFNYHMKSVSLFWDAIPSPSIVDVIGENLEGLGFELISSHPVDMSSLARLNLSCKEGDHDRLSKTLGNLKVPIDRQKLLDFTRHGNPALYNLLMAGGDLETALHQSLRDINQISTNIHVLAITNFSAYLSKQAGESHVLLLLDNYKVVAPVTVTRAGELAYHFLGKKCRYYGGGNPVLSSGEPSAYYSFIDTSTMFDQLPTIQKNYVQELLNHEFAGHGVLGLDDHFDTPFDQCIMATKRTRDEFLTVCKNFSGLYFCDECKRRIQN